MEDDDDFGDLYTDVLQAFHGSSSSQPHQSSEPSKHPPIDLNLQFGDDDSVPGPSYDVSLTISKQSVVQAVDLKPVAEPFGAGIDESGLAGDSAEDQILGKDQYLAGGEKNFESDSTDFTRFRVLEKGNVNLKDGGLNILNHGVKSGVGGIEGNEKDGILGKIVDFDDEGHDNVTFDVEEVCDDLEEQQLIPGLSSSGVSLIPGVAGSSKVDASMNYEPSGEGDDWDSDSEDDLQIVLNDDAHGHMAMDGGVQVGSDDDDGDPLVIVTDGDGLNHQGMGEQEWGEDGAQAADGERNDIGDGTKGNGGIPVAPKVGYSNHGYHPFHAQFKYVRPGTAPIAGVPPMGPPGGAPGQVRPPITMGPIAGRGRGDWRPPGIKTSPMQKAFHPGFGIPPWGNGPLGRGFGGGLDFTLPSHKTIFEVDIDSFEDKPWKCHGADITDFFNFGLNEESWKIYFKQLEQLRLESTMQSKIRVYESGRTEHDYDPDMPPELAAATNVNDGYLERTSLTNEDDGQIDLTKGSAPVRPPLMTGRAIPVEAGYGERLPSIDTRAPRNRDSDAIIEIVLQDDDCSPGEPSDNNSLKVDPKESYLEVDVARVETECVNDHLHSYNGKNRELVGRRAPFMNTDHDNTDDGDGVLNYPASVNPDSRGQSPDHPPSNYAIPNTERRGRQHDRSPQRTVSQSSRDKYTENKREKSLDGSLDEKHSPLLSSPATDRSATEPSFEQIDAVNNELVVADGNSEMEADEMPPSKIIAANNSAYSKKKQKVSSRLHHNEIQEVGEGDDSKAARSRGNSKARPMSNRDFHKTRESVVKDDVIHDRSYNKRNLDEDEQSFRRRDRNGKPEIERKVREDSYPCRDWDPNSSHTSFMKNEGFDRRKERDSSVGVRQKRFEDPQGRPIRTDDSRKRDFGDEMGSRHWGKGRDRDRSDKDEHLLLRKPLDNGNWKERDDTLKGRYENMDDYYSKRRKDDEHTRRDYGEKEEILLGHRDIINHRKREREDIMDQQRRGGQPRIRDNLDDHHSVRKKDEIWLQRERGEKQIGERHILKQAHEENLSKRERDDGHGAVKSVRGSEDKLVSHSRARDEYRGSDKDYQTIKDTGRHSAQVKRKDRSEDESLSHHNRGRGDNYPAVNQISNEDRRSRQEKLSTRNDPSQHVDKKPKDTTKKNRDSEGLDYSTLSISKRNQEDHSSHRNETVNPKGASRQEKEAQENSVHRQSSKKHKENASSEDEHQDSRRGRSKLERWTSHKERDFGINNKSSSSSLKLNKEIDRHNNGGSSKLHEVDMDKQPLDVEKDAVGDVDMKDAGSKPVDERHLDTVAKLKKRSERFKLPMLSEKETITNKKNETEALANVESDASAGHTVIKQERPARKRRWVSS